METVSRERIYSIIAEELENDHYIQDLRKRALQAAEGDPHRAQEVYVEYRLQQLEEKIKESERSIRSLRDSWRQQTEQRLLDAHRLRLQERSLLRTDWGNVEETVGGETSRWVVFAPLAIGMTLLVYGLIWW